MKHFWYVLSWVNVLLMFYFVARLLHAVIYDEMLFWPSFWCALGAKNIWDYRKYVK